jgi:ABC-type nickel/cobalt efflux system permease component RcnA
MQRRSVLSAGGALAAFCLVAMLAILMLPGSAATETKPPTPFTGPATTATPPSAFAPPAAARQAPPSAFGGVFGWVLRTQQSLQRELAQGVKGLKSGNAMRGAVVLAALSFVYGVVHAVGPGHGKTIISSYVVANEETVRRGVIISFIAAGLQALTAIALVGVFVFVLNASGLQINAWSKQLEQVS